MRIEGSYHFDAPPPVVYAALQDEELIRAAMPGGLHFARTSPTTFEAAIELNVPRFSNHYAGSVTITDTVQDSFYDLLVQGAGNHSHISASGRVTLTPGEDGTGTQVSYAGDTDAADHLNRVARAVVQRLAVQIVNLGLRRLQNEIARREEDAAFNQAFSEVRGGVDQPARDPAAAHDGPGGEGPTPDQTSAPDLPAGGVDQSDRSPL